MVLSFVHRHNIESSEHFAAQAGILHSGGATQCVRTRIKSTLQLMAPSLGNAAQFANALRLESTRHDAHAVQAGVARVHCGGPRQPEISEEHGQHTSG